MDISFVLEQIGEIETRLKFLREYVTHNIEKDKKKDNILYEKLRSLRNMIAREENVSPFIVMYNSTLQDIAEKCPVTIEDFKKIKGVGDFKSAKYGDRFIMCILEHNNV